MLKILLLYFLNIIFVIYGYCISNSVIWRYDDWFWIDVSCIVSWKKVGMIRMMVIGYFFGEKFNFLKKIIYLNMRLKDIYLVINVNYFSWEN